MSDIDSKYLNGLTAIEVLKNAYPGTLSQLIIDIQNQINDYRRYIDNSSEPGYKISDKELFDMNEEIDKKTNYVKALLEFHAAYNYPSKEIDSLCKFYGIKNFNDNLTVK